MMTEKANRPPKVFISYAWENDLQPWVLDLATRLRADGVNIILDQWDTSPGDPLPEFMEKSVRESDFVVFICTPKYKRKSNRRKGGVGYEGHIITGEVFSQNNHRKFIPVLRKGKWTSAAPSWAVSKLFVDLIGDPYNEANYQYLLKTLLGHSPSAPPVEDDMLDGQNNAKKQTKKQKPPRKIDIAVVVALIGLVGTIIAALIGSPILANLLSLTPESTTLPLTTFTLTIPIPTKTIVPSPTITSTPRPRYTIVDPQEVLEIAPNLRTLGQLAVEKYSIEERNGINVTLPFTVYSTTDVPILWRWFWCAVTNDVLEQNMTKISIIFDADGYVIPEEKLATVVFENSDPVYEGWKCRTYQTVLRDWSPGTHVFTQTMTISQAINDGREKFEAGYKIYEYTVHISPQSSSASEDAVTFTSPPPLNEIVDSKGVQMVLVPAGEFIRGSYKGNGNEEPVRTINLDAFYIDKYEVSNGLYKDCVNSGNCEPPEHDDSRNRSRYYSDSAFDNFPVIYVDWNMAKAYCEWRGAQLPTEAQWEKAARGENGQMYPWGNTFDGSKVNFCDKNCLESIADMNFDDGYVDTSPIGHYEGGKSPYGIYDMAGNVWEWVADWYSGTYYQSSPLSNPLGPNSGQERVVRGGGWDYYYNFVRSSARYSHDPANNYSYVGFRCAKDATP